MSLTNGSARWVKFASTLHANALSKKALMVEKRLTVAIMSYGGEDAVKLTCRNIEHQQISKLVRGACT